MFSMNLIEKAKPLVSAFCRFLYGGIMRKITTFLGKVVVGMAICVLVTTGLKIALNFTVAKALQAKEKIVDVLPKKEVAQRSLNLEESIVKASKTNGVDPLILHVISDKESSGGNQRALYRFEPHLFSRLRGDRNYRELSDSEVRMLASSHGVFHILGLTAERECGLHFSKLYDTEKSAMCAARIVRRIDETVKAKATEHRLREIFRQYNGQGPAAETYAKDAMVRLAAILYQRTNG
jgi:hypothetical protein